ncbi:MAG: hypothetical protein AAB669_02860 [Patescibacteria group bacterium]
MRKFQFEVLEAYNAGSLERQLNESGSEGFRLAGYGTNGESNPDKQIHFTIMERELPDDGSDIPTGS